LTACSDYLAVSVEKVVQYLHNYEDILEVQKYTDVKESFKVGRKDDKLIHNT